MNDEQLHSDAAEWKAPTSSSPPAVKVTREIGFVIIVVAVLICASIMRGLDRLSGETYAIVLSGTLIMAASLQGGSAMRALEALLLRR